MGSGRTELLMSVFGAHPGRVTGQIVVSGKVVQIRRPADAIANGIALVTEDRKRYGLFFEQTVLRNMTMSALRRISGSFITDEAREFAVSTPLFERLRIKANSLSRAVGTLSGGNQQKVVLARCLLTEPRILFLDEPTRGIDVGAKQEIYFEIDRLAQSGLALVIISSELPEVLGLSDRVIVLHKGKVTGEFTRENVTPEALMACATGHTVEATSAIPRMVD
jgi:ABC-type sugar transport system ATPase subunit